MAVSPEIHEGFIPFGQYKTWYRSVGVRGKPGHLPLLVLHGGPGSPHDYLEPLEELSGTGRQVVFYDQLGCGNSDTPEDLSLYTFDLFTTEIDAVRQALNLDRVHLFGHSWGGMLAIQYALQQPTDLPTGLASLVLADTAASTAQWMAEANKLVEELPEDVRQTIRQHEQAGTTASAEYQKACRVFYGRHAGGRIYPRPECLSRMKGKPGDAVYQYMWGPSEWFVTGTIRDWDVSARLGEIQVPALILVGRYDHATPLLSRRLQQGIAGSKLVVFENSGHFPHLEETSHFLKTVSDFLSSVENKYSFPS